MKSGAVQVRREQGTERRTNLLLGGPKNFPFDLLDRVETAVDAALALDNATERAPASRHLFQVLKVVVEP